MTRLISKLTFILVNVLLFISCQKDNIELKSSFLDQKIVFQKEFVNHAWGYHHNGWFIDTSGTVYSYNLPGHWNQFDSLDYLSNSLMTENLENSNLITINIDQSILFEKMKLIEEASKGELTQPNNVMFDAGISAYYCLKYNAEENKYQRILLKQVGDFSIDNKSKAAKELFSWLEEIDKEIRDAD